MGPFPSSMTAVLSEIAGDFFHYRTGNFPLKTHESGLPGIQYRTGSLSFILLSLYFLFSSQRFSSLLERTSFLLFWLDLTGRVWEFHLLYLGASEE